MFNRLEIFQKRYNELNTRLYDPAVAANPDEYSKVMRELKELEPVALKYGEYKAALKSEEEALAILNEGGIEPELK